LEIQRILFIMDHSIEAYCTLSALCAYMMIQPNMNVPHHLLPQVDGSPVLVSRFGYDLLHETLRVHSSHADIEHPTIHKVYTAFFISKCCSGLDKQDAAWTYLRQATTLAHIMGLHDENYYQTKDSTETILERRMFWALFITER